MSYLAPRVSAPRHPGQCRDVPAADPSPLPDGTPSRGSFRAFYPITTRWGDDDAYGHANNVQYLAWFDTAVNGHLMRASGTDVRELDAIGLVVETACRYLSGVGFPDALEVGLAVPRLGRTSVTYRLGVLKAGEDEVRAVGRFVHVYVDATTRRPVPVPDVLRTVMEDLVAD